MFLIDFLVVVQIQFCVVIDCDSVLQVVVGLLVCCQVNVEQIYLNLCQCEVLGSIVIGYGIVIFYGCVLILDCFCGVLLCLVVLVDFGGDELVDLVFVMVVLVYYIYQYLMLLFELVELFFVLDICQVLCEVGDVWVLCEVLDMILFVSVV